MLFYDIHYFLVILVAINGGDVGQKSCYNHLLAQKTLSILAIFFSICYYFPSFISHACLFQYYRKLLQECRLSYLSYGPHI